MCTVQRLEPDIHSQILSAILQHTCYIHSTLLWNSNNTNQLWHANSSCWITMKPPQNPKCWIPTKCWTHLKYKLYQPSNTLVIWNKSLEYVLWKTRLDWLHTNHHHYHHQFPAKGIQLTSWTTDCNLWWSLFVSSIQLKSSPSCSMSCLTTSLQCVQEVPLGLLQPTLDGTKWYKVRVGWSGDEHNR